MNVSLPVLADIGSRGSAGRRPLRGAGFGVLSALAVGMGVFVEGGGVCLVEAVAVVGVEG